MAGKDWMEGHREASNVMTLQGSAITCVARWTVAVLGPFGHDAVLGSVGCQILILRVSGITKRAITKHTAGIAIG